MIRHDEEEQVMIRCWRWTNSEAMFCDRGGVSDVGTETYNIRSHSLRFLPCIHPHPLRASHIPPWDTTTTQSLNNPVVGGKDRITYPEEQSRSDRNSNLIRRAILFLVESHVIRPSFPWTGSYSFRTN